MQGQTIIALAVCFVTASYSYAAAAKAAEVLGHGRSFVPRRRLLYTAPSCACVCSGTHEGYAPGVTSPPPSPKHTHTLPPPLPSPMFLGMA